MSTKALLENADSLFNSREYEQARPVYQQAAEYLGVKPSTIYQWTHQGFIPHVKLGRLVRFRLSVIEKWVDKKSENGRLQRKMSIDRFEV